MIVIQIQLFECPCGTCGEIQSQLVAFTPEPHEKTEKENKAMERVIPQIAKILKALTPGASVEVMPGCGEKNERLAQDLNNEPKQN